MGKKVFLFDLDATVSKVEILPMLAEQVGLLDEMRELTEKTMRGELPFKSSFLSRVEMLEQTPLNEEIVKFIQEHKECCYIVTGNLDIWIRRLMKRIGLPMAHCFCSSASVVEDRLVAVNSVIDKGLVVKQFILPVVAIGDGSNDAEMARLAEVGIGFGGVRPIAYSLMCNATHAIYDEKRLRVFLETLFDE